MGKFLAVLLAYILSCIDYHIFRSGSESEEQEHDYSYYIFLTVEFFLLLEISMFPRSLRKLNGFSQIIVEFPVAKFLMEHILFDFWIPLEEKVKLLSSQAGDKLEELTDYDGTFSDVTELLKSPSTQSAIGIALSVYFLLCVLHATKIVDFSLLFRCSPLCFFDDIKSRITRCVNRTFFGNRHVRIQENNEEPYCSTGHDRDNNNNNKRFINDFNMNYIRDIDTYDDFKNIKNLDELKEDLSKFDQLEFDRDSTGSSDMKITDFDFPDDLLLNDD